MKIRNVVFGISFMLHPFFESPNRYDLSQITQNDISLFISKIISYPYKFASVITTYLVFHIASNLSKVEEVV